MRGSASRDLHRVHLVGKPVLLGLMSKLQTPTAEPPVARVERTAFAIGAILLAVAGVAFVLFGTLNHDEGWYLYAARLVFEGELPYRDFVFYQAPLLPYIYGIPQLVSSGVETGRWTSFAISAGMCALAMRTAGQRGGAVAVGVFIAGILGSPLALWTLTSTRTEPLCALFLTTSVFFLTRPSAGRLDGELAVLAGALAAATRISMVPAALYILIWALRRFADSRTDAVRIAAPLVTVALVAGVVIFSGGFDRGWVNLVEIQSQRYEQFRDVRPITAFTWFWSRVDFLRRLGAEFGVVTVISCLSAIGFLVTWIVQPAARSASSRVSIGSSISLLALIALIPNLVPRSAFTVYFVALLPLVLIVGGWGVAALSRSLQTLRIDPRAIVPLSVLIMVGAVLIQTITFDRQSARWLRSSPSDLELLRVAALEVEARIPEEKELLTFDTYLAVEAHRYVPPGFEMSVFSWFPRRPAEDGQHLGLLTTDRLQGSFTDPAVGGAALSDVSLGVLVAKSHAGFRPKHVLTERDLWKLLQPLQDFQLAHQMKAFGQLHAPLYLLVRKESR
jgi:hypothetical protein